LLCFWLLSFVGLLLLLLEGALLLPRGTLLLQMWRLDLVLLLVCFHTVNASCTLFCWTLLCCIASWGCAVYACSFHSCIGSTAAAASAIARA
jgi:hypothetical protein